MSKLSQLCGSAGKGKKPADLLQEPPPIHGGDTWNRIDIGTSVDAAQTVAENKRTNFRPWLVYVEKNFSKYILHPVIRTELK